MPSSGRGLWVFSGSDVSFLLAVCEPQACPGDLPAEVRLLTGPLRLKFARQCLNPTDTRRLPYWVDASEPDPEAAVDFYSGLFSRSRRDAAELGGQVLHRPGEGGELVDICPRRTTDTIDQWPRIWISGNQTLPRHLGRARDQVLRRGYTTNEGSELEEALASLRSKYEECGRRSSV
jgi:hypothetical protein